MIMIMTTIPSSYTSSLCTYPDLLTQHTALNNSISIVITSNSCGRSRSFPCSPCKYNYSHLTAHSSVQLHHTTTCTFTLDRVFNSLHSFSPLHHTIACIFTCLSLQSWHLPSVLLVSSWSLTKLPSPSNAYLKGRTAFLKAQGGWSAE